MRSLVLLAALIVLGTVTQSVHAVERIEEPLTFRHAINFKSNTALMLGRLDMNKIGAEDAVNSHRGNPLRVAVARKETPAHEFEQLGEWSVIDDMSVWRLKVKSEDARWLSFTFDNIFLPSGAGLFIYNASRQQVFGPYTDQHNKSSGKLWTPMVAGDEAYIEINVPTAVKPYLTFDLKSVNHGYRSFKASNFQKSGTCNIDVVCPQGDDWRAEIRSVARYFFERDGGFLTCTGNLLNNTGGDRKAYFLTANHCVSTEAEARSMVFFWNFETSVCGGNPDGSSAQTQGGATLRATLGSLDGPLPQRDMTLVELDSSPSAAFDVYYSGWDADPLPPASGVSIHHPDGDEKRISLDSGPIAITNYFSSQENPNGTHLRIASWDEGTTEQGSSGAGFWNSDRRLVGVLSGGGASCSSPNEADYYAHLASHYDIGTSSSTQFKAWLDPANTGATQVDGLESCNAPTVSITVNPNPAEVNIPVTFTSTVTGGTGTNYTYAWDFDGDGSIDSTLASPVFTYANTYIGNVDLTVSSSPCSESASAAIVVFPEGGNSAPIASAVAALNSADEGSPVQLDGSGSTDPNADALTYEWTQTSGPMAALSSQSDVAPTVTLPMVAADIDVVFQLAVTDMFGASDTDVVVVSVINVNRAPTAIVSNTTISINEGSTVSLNAGASSDADGDSLSFSWTQTAGTAVNLSNTGSATPTFSAPQVTSSSVLTFVVTVSDPLGLTDSATVNVTVNNVAPPPTGGGGGGALGWPLISVMFFLGCARRLRLRLASTLMVSSMLLIACGTSEPNPVAPQSSEPVAAVTVWLVRNDDARRVAQITDAEHLDQVMTALQNRERRYEKIKPLFEYKIQINVNAEEEIWQVSPTGYIQKADSHELYRMDMSTLRKYMD